METEWIREGPSPAELSLVCVCGGGGGRGDEATGRAGDEVLACLEIGEVAGSGISRPGLKFGPCHLLVQVA